MPFTTFHNGSQLFTTYHNFSHPDFVFMINVRYRPSYWMSSDCSHTFLVARGIMWTLSILLRVVMPVSLVRMHVLHALHVLHVLGLRLLLSSFLLDAYETALSAKAMFFRGVPALGVVATSSLFSYVGPRSHPRSEDGDGGDGNRLNG